MPNIKKTIKGKIVFINQDMENNRIYLINIEAGPMEFDFEILNMDDKMYYSVGDTVKIIIECKEDPISHESFRRILEEKQRIHNEKQKIRSKLLRPGDPGFDLL